MLKQRQEVIKSKWIFVLIILILLEHYLDIWFKYDIIME